MGAYVIRLRTFSLENALNGTTTAGTGHLHTYEGVSQHEAVRRYSGSCRLHGMNFDVEPVGVFGR